MAILYAVIALIANTISVFSVKELPQEENEKKDKKDDVSIVQALKILFTNKYFILLLLIYISIYLQTGIQGMTVYFMRDILGELEDISGFIPLEPMGDCGEQWGEFSETNNRHIMAVILPEPGESWSLDVQYRRAISVHGIYGESTAITTLGDWSAVVHFA